MSSKPTSDNGSEVDVLQVIDVPSSSGPSTPKSAMDGAAVSGKPTEEHHMEGSRCEVQTLYEGEPKCKCCTNWVEQYPTDLRKAVDEKPETKQKALVVRMCKNHEEGKPLVLDSISVQSSSLKETLGEVFEGYEGITTSLKKLVFKAPFRPFHYRWKRLTDILERQKNEASPAAAYTQLLYDVLSKELGDARTEIDDLFSQGVTTYEYLWALFEPGSLVYASFDGHERLFVVDQCDYNEKMSCLIIEAKFTDWDGSQFGYTKQLLPMCRFSGTRKITDLNIYPARLHPFEEEMKSKLIARGKKFQTLLGAKYKAYSGSIRYHKEKRSTETLDGKRNIDERIMVDAEAYFEANPKMKFSALTDDPLVPQIDVTDYVHVAAPGRTTTTTTSAMSSLNSKDTTAVKEAMRDLKVDELAIEGKDAIDNPTDEQLLLCNSKVRGYSLKTKLWGEFDVDGVADIAWNDDAFSNLLLPAGYKNLILSFINEKGSNQPAFDDIIEGKGLGIVMLLVGNPGIGKTLTAEAVADKVRRPLYVLSAGELGQKAETVEKRLNVILQLAERWDVVLLFDECDVFLQQRSKGNLAHNEIVAVFLRVIEYYRGVLIMTSNRGNAIDRAFQSRIHLTLHYPELEKATKEQIWRRLTTQTGQNTSLDDHAYQNLAKLPMNGRQIRNVVKVALLLAGREETTLGMQQIRTVLEATQEAGDEASRAWMLLD
ncbi:ATPase [Fusarium albosuccineum]|uniref:ATPase n=1 Tax=Fusarium albosuccineum TaxID=1237068 RepID=A0A8H4LC63_9HYPO|nr:ATPase [Fusarium albosuccineum]